jgi:hypothetical protein
MTRRQPQRAAQAVDRAQMVAVYDGQRCLGHVLGRGKAGFEAFDIANQRIGLSSTQREAAAAIMGVE